MDFPKPGIKREREEATAEGESPLKAARTQSDAQDVTVPVPAAGDGNPPAAENANLKPSEAVVSAPASKSRETKAPADVISADAQPAMAAPSSTLAQPGQATGATPPATEHAKLRSVPAEVPAPVVKADPVLHGVAKREPEIATVGPGDDGGEGAGKEKSLGVAVASGVKAEGVAVAAAAEGAAGASGASEAVGGGGAPRTGEGVAGSPGASGAEGGDGAPGTEKGVAEATASDTAGAVGGKNNVSFAKGDSAAGPGDKGAPAGKDGKADGDKHEAVKDAEGAASGSNVASAAGQEDEDDDDDLECEADLDLASMRQHEAEQVAKFNASQLQRYESYRRSDLKTAKVKKVLAALNPLLAKSSEHFLVAVKGLSKLFVGDVVEMALEVRHECEETGPLQPKHLHEAYRRLQAKGGIPSINTRRNGLS